MKAFTRSRDAFVVCAAVMFSGCGGPQPAISVVPSSLVGPPAPFAIQGRPAPDRKLGHIKQATYTWTEWKPGFNPKLPTDLNFFNGGVIGTLLIPMAASYADGKMFALLNKKDNAGDYALWLWYTMSGINYYTFEKEYLTAIVADGSMSRPPVWGLAQSGRVFSSYQSTGQFLTHYFPAQTFTSLAVHNPAVRNPKGFLFATSKSKTYMGSGPPGSAVMLFVPSLSKKWPNGTWKTMPFGAYQVSADPQGNTIADLDDNGNVWQIAATYNKSNKFLGWVVQSLGDVQCSNSQGIGFLEVAVKNGTFLGLDQLAVGSPEITNAVWYYDASGKCWKEVGTRAFFLSIATDTFKYGAFVWASDTKGNVWYAH
jgi:hypothetical protein